MNNPVNNKSDVYQSSRVFYIIYAAVDYFISIIVGSTYLAKLGTAVGLDDATIGLITSFLALGCGFQIVSVFISPSVNRKRLVIFFVLFEQLCFSVLYLLPFVNINGGLRIGIFVSLILIAHILKNICGAQKASWSRGIVPADRLGRYFAVCEIISLVSGMLFTFAMGGIIDYLEARDRLMLAFAIFCIVSFVLTAASTVLLLLMKDKPQEVKKNENQLNRIKNAFTDKKTLILIPLYILWYAALYVSTPFFGTYAIGELGFTMTAISIISAVYAVLRALVSRPIGAFADKTSFVNSITLGFLTFAIALVILSFGGKASYIIYYLLYAVTLACTNQGLINMVYDYVDAEKRASSLAILYTVAGFSGFFSTLAVRPLVERIQSSGNSFWVLDGIYAQQVVAILGAIISVICVLYANVVIRRLPRIPKGKSAKKEPEITENAQPTAE